MIAGLQISKRRFASVDKIHVGDTDDDFINNRTSIKISGTDDQGRAISEVLKLNLDRDDHIQTSYVWCLDCGVFKVGEPKPLVRQAFQGEVLFRPLEFDEGEHDNHHGIGMIDVTEQVPSVRDHVRCFRELVKWNGESASAQK